LVILFSACVSEPKEVEYRDYTYEEIIEKFGNPKYDNIFVVNNDTDLSFIDPNYSLYFAEEELEHGVQVRKIVWENNFHYRRLFWLKHIEGQWIVFDSLEYNSKYIKF
jgi:hypothetical protein